MKKGDTKQVNHPEEKNEDGTAVLYTIKVTGAAECLLLPEDNEFAAKWHYESIEKFKEAIVNMLRLQYRSIAQDKMRRQLRNELIRLYAFDLPQTLVEMETEGRYLTFRQSVPQTEPADKETDRKPFLDSVKRYFTCLYLLQPFYEFVAKEVPREELVRELEHQTHDIPFTQRVITLKLDQEELVRRLVTSIYLRRAEDYCLQKILGAATLNEEQQKELRETALPVELHESIGVAPHTEH
jgi:FKBP-type peptidyl-prolyl cis-trans isomerase (trigger factor)